MTTIYKLENRKAVPCTFNQYTDWIAAEDAQAKSVVAQDRIGDKFISTVFLSADVSSGFGEPELFETAVFHGSKIESVTRYPTWEAAEDGHQAITKNEREKHGNK